LRCYFHENTLPFLNHTPTNSSQQPSLPTRNRFNALFLDFLIRVLKRGFGEKCKIVEIDTL